MEEMNEFSPPEHAPNRPPRAPAPRGGAPRITYAVIAVCAAIFLYLNLAGNTREFAAIADFLVPSSVAIWYGAWWGLLTSAFVHVAFWHILFNMWWTKDFGAVLEPIMGRGRFVLFILLAAAASSGAQLAFSGELGIGFSGVVYALFGYALAARHVEPECRRILSGSTIALLLGWLVLCVFLTTSNIWPVANYAHIGGFLFGFFAGHIFAARERVIPSVVGLAGLAAVTILSVSYMPWSPNWKSREAAGPEVQFRQGAILMRGNAAQREKAMIWLRESAEQGYVPAMNALAWTLCTDKDESRRNGAEALQWAERACAADGHKTAAYLDTLAAAYAELDRWDEAVAMQRKAIEAASAEESRRDGYDARLQAYLRREKTRE